MINSINSVQGSYNTAMQNQLQAQPQSVTIPQQSQNVNMNGINALASYNQPVQAQTRNIQPALPTILQPDAIKAIQGERIYAPDGSLCAIIKNDGKTTTIYKMEISAPNDAIRKIEYYDSTTGKLKAVQENSNDIQEGKVPKLTFCEIKNFDDNGRINKFTCYQDGKLLLVKEKEFGQNGYEKEYTAYENENIAHENFGNGYRKTTIFDKKGNVNEVINFDDNNNTLEHIKYKNGIPTSITRESDIPIGQIPNGKCPATDPELAPAQPYILGYDPKQVQGDKKYYSNGAIHSITTKTQNGEITHMFDINGNLTGIEDAQNPQNPKSIIYSEASDIRYGHYSIVENIDNNKEKTTIYENDGSYEVVVYNHDTKEEKSLSYSKDGIIQHYYEGNGKDNEMFMTFNKQGNLINVK